MHQWNWGGFCFNFIWAICNGVPWAFITLIPVVSFGSMFYLGAKGNELAWKYKDWESVEHFQHVQRMWACAGAFFGVIVAVQFGLAMWNLKQVGINMERAHQKAYGPSAQLSLPVALGLEAMEHNPKSAELLGAPIDNPTEGVGAIDQEQKIAEMSIPVKGSARKGVLYVRAQEAPNEPGYWVIKKAVVDIEKVGRIPLPEAGYVGGLGKRRNVNLATPKLQTTKYEAPIDPTAAEGILHSVAFTDAMEELKKHSEAETSLGSPYTFSFTGGKLAETGPFGEGELTFNVQGKQRSGIMTIKVTKALGDWRMNGGDVKVDQGEAGAVQIHLEPNVHVD